MAGYGGMRAARQPHPGTPVRATMETESSISSYSQLLGIERFEQADDGTFHVTLPTAQKHANMGGWVHGGVLAGLLDFALGSAVVHSLNEDEWTATMSLTTDYLRPAKPGATLVGKAQVDRRGRLAAFASGEVVDEMGVTLARATGVWAIRGGRAHPPSPQASGSHDD